MMAKKNKLLVEVEVVSFSILAHVWPRILICGPFTWFSRPCRCPRRPEAWENWLRRHGLGRLLRHDSRRRLRSDGSTMRAAQLEVENFQIKGVADGQVRVGEVWWTWGWSPGDHNQLVMVNG